MIQIARPLFALAFAIALTACQRQAEPAKPADPAPAAAPATPAATPAPVAAISVGVPECDSYITKYLACVSTKVPEASRAAMQSNMNQMREAWAASAGTEAGRAALAQSCTLAKDSAKTAMVAFGCTDF
ncbi:MAG: hypothetical protein ABI411_17400 [Tahibacter sp.]